MTEIVFGASNFGMGKPKVGARIKVDHPTVGRRCTTSHHARGNPHTPMVLRLREDPDNRGQWLWAENSRLRPAVVCFISRRPKQGETIVIKEVWDNSVLAELE